MTRIRRNANANTEGVVQEFLETSYDIIKEVHDNLDNLQAVVDAINNLDPDSFATAAQGLLADSALQPADLSTLGLLNALVTDATLIDTADPRLSDSRDPNAHTHSELDITDLQTYLQTSDIDSLAELNAIVLDATLIDTADARLSDDRNPTAHTHPYTELTAMPTTLLGYGITDAYTKAEVDAHDHAFADLTATPTTLAGYGITDAFSGNYNDLIEQPNIKDSIDSYGFDGDMESQRIMNLANPVELQDAVSKAYLNTVLDSFKNELLLVMDVRIELKLGTTIADLYSGGTSIQTLLSAGLLRV